MKLVRFGTKGNEKPAVALNDETLLDVSSVVKDYDEEFFRESGIEKLKKELIDNRERFPKVPKGTRIGSPIARPSKLICVGLNYAQHAKESGMPVPKEPVLFFKATTAICGPNDDVIIPKNSTKTDWEVELAVVISKEASYVSKADAMQYVVGYMVHNDVSERAFQIEREGQWVKGKSCDTFAPLGPYLVTKDEIDNPHNLKLWLKVNGQIMQNSTTADLIFDIPHLVSYISQFMTLLPGDVISTGTPFGVGLGLTPPVYLKEGDVMELGIDGLGVAKQKAINYK